MMKGMVFAERYKLEEFIGQGGMSLVYRAVDIRTGHSVAVKILKSEYNGDKEFLERFQREAQAASLMSHHNIVNLLDVGVDTDTLFARLYLEAYEYLKFKAEIYRRMQITENGVAYVHIDKATQEKFNLTAEVASTSVGFMDSIRGCLCWIAFIDNCDEENTIRVRLRSRFASINTIAERYRGGGHACACGATLLAKKEMKAMLKEADALIKEYKETHEGWL